MMIKKTGLIGLCLLILCACETPGSKALSLDPQLGPMEGPRDGKSKKGYVRLKTQLAAKSSPVSNKAATPIDIVDKQQTLHRLLKSALNQNGWVVIDEDSPLTPALLPVSLTTTIKAFDIYLLAETTKDIVHSNFTLELDFAYGTQGFKKVLDKRSDREIAFKAQNEHVIKFAEESLVKLVESIIRKNYFAQLELKN